jgi:undecaprenyl pyrophosphate phosphatase UppP
MTVVTALTAADVLAVAGHACPAHMSYAEAGAVGLIQGVSELFPVSSLGHNALIPPQLRHRFLRRSYLSVRFLVRWLRTRTLTPSGVYCPALGLGGIVYLELLR